MESNILGHLIWYYLTFELDDNHNDAVLFYVKLKLSSKNSGNREEIAQKSSRGNRRADIVTRKSRIFETL